MKSTKDRIVTVYCPFSALKAIAESLTKATLDAETHAKTIRALDALNAQYVDTISDAPKYERDAEEYKHAQGLAYGLITCAEYDIPFWSENDEHGVYFAGEEYPAVAQAEPF